MARSAATATATRRAPRSAPRTAARDQAEQPDLAVVPRPRGITLPMVLGTAVIVAIAFGALSVQISLIHRQQQLDEVRAEITEVQLANKELRQKESRLQSPSEILRIARDELGMVESKPPELVTPAVETVGASGVTPTSTPTPTDGSDPAAPTDG